MSTRPLTPKQQRFVQEYLLDLNATAAYKRAGYVAQGNAAEVNANRMLRNAKVAAAIQAGQCRRAHQTGIDAARVLRELALVAFSDIGEIMDFGGAQLKLRTPADIPEAARRAIASVKVKRYFEGAGEEAREVELTEFKLWSKDSALEKLAKHLGLYAAEKHELNITSDLDTFIADQLAGLARAG